jgi:dTDP-4-amino-4,6-dideoxygalactose transaminase
MNIPLVDLKKQYLTIKAEIDEAVANVISESAFVGGKYVRAFEEHFAAFCGAKHCIGVANGTDALFVALKMLGIGPGDEVIVPANSFIATSEAVTMAGARPAFVDIDPQTYTMDPNKLEEYLKRRGSRVAGREPAAASSPTRPSVLGLPSGPSLPCPRAVIPVHLYGHPADMDPILELARRYGLKVIEDAAQAHGAEYKGRRIGSLGDAACFSFYPGKNLGAYGDGGAVVTNDGALAEEIRMFANHGRMDKYDHKIEGVNSRLDGLQAAILDAKLRHMEPWNEGRREAACRYSRHLAGAGLVLPRERDYAKPVYHLYVVRTPEGLRQGLQEHLAGEGIATGIHYPIALPNLKAYAHMGHGNGDFPEATRASREILSLPMFPELDEPQICHIAESIKRFLGR